MSAQAVATGFTAVAVCAVTGYILLARQARSHEQEMRAAQAAWQRPEPREDWPAEYPGPEWFDREFKAITARLSNGGRAGT